MYLITMIYEEVGVMNKIIIVGNGFDLVHGLKTSFKDSAQFYKKDSTLNEFHKLVDEIDSLIPIYDRYGNLKDVTWYSFEENIERIVYSIFQKNLRDNLSQKQYVTIEKDISNDSYIINFNYTDTVKLYTKYCNYIHGSISKDNYIVLVFANDNIPDTSTNQYGKYLK